MSVFSKRAYKNHIAKNFGNELYKLKSEHKNITTEVIALIQKCFSYAIAQNKGNKDSTKAALEALVPHMFNDHDRCNLRWCKTLTDKKYTQTVVLTGKDLKCALQKLLDRYIITAMLDNLINVDSTNRNENLNHLISRKAPKAITYSESESLDFRVLAAIAQKNEGHTYLMQVNELQGLSPGHYTSKKMTTLDKLRDDLAKKQKSSKQKKRRNILKSEKMSNNLRSEVYEGKTYETGIGHTETNDDDIMNIQCNSLDQTNSPTFSPEDVVVFYLEATGLGSTSSIIQIAAVGLTTQANFNIFVKPSCGLIPTTAANITGLEYRAGVMYKDCEKVDSQDAKEALREFICWIESFNRPILLVAHNAMFDARLLLSNLIKESIHIQHDKFWFTDSLKYFKQLYPGKTSYKLGYLVKEIMNVYFKAHDALEDCQALSGLLNLNLLSEFQHLASQTFSVVSVQNKLRELRDEKLYKPSYSYFVENKLISRAQITRLARSGLSLDHLRTVYSRSGLDGLEIIIKDRGEKKGYAKLASILKLQFDEQQKDE